MSGIPGTISMGEWVMGAVSTSISPPPTPTFNPGWTLSTNQSVQGSGSYAS